MITITLSLLLAHFIADFVLQSDWMAINKSKSLGALCLHTSLYSIVFMPFWGWQFAAWTFVLHTLQDAVTSRINSKLYQAGQRHWFFVGVGADQLLHYVQLAYLAKWLGV